MKEEAIQKTVIQYLAAKRRRHYHVPNGGYRNPAEGAKFKALGVSPGVPDIVVPYAKSGSNGLYLELKSESGRITKCQEEWLEFLNDENYLAVCSYSLDEAIEIIDEYFST